MAEEHGQEKVGSDILSIIQQHDVYDQLNDIMLQALQCRPNRFVLAQSLADRHSEAQITNLLAPHILTDASENAYKGIVGLTKVIDQIENEVLPELEALATESKLDVDDMKRVLLRQKEKRLHLQERAREYLSALCKYLPKSVDLDKVIDAFIDDKLIAQQMHKDMRLITEHMDRQSIKPMSDYEAFHNLYHYVDRTANRTGDGIMAAKLVQEYLESGDEKDPVLINLNEGMQLINTCAANRERMIEVLSKIKQEFERPPQKQVKSSPSLFKRKIKAPVVDISREMNKRMKDDPSFVIYHGVMMELNPVIAKLFDSVMSIRQELDEDLKNIDNTDTSEEQKKVVKSELESKTAQIDSLIDDLLEIGSKHRQEYLHLEIILEALTQNEVPSKGLK